MRPATPLDAGAIAAVHVSSWQEAYARLLPPEVLDAHAQGAPRRWAERLSNPDGPWYWLAEGNHRACAFYARHGLRADGERRVVAEWGGIAVIRMVR